MKQKMDGRISRIFNFIAIILLFLMSCGSNGPFHVKVYSTEGQPVAGAQISGGIDWDYFSVETDVDGVALLPGNARGQRATICATNFYPSVVEYLAPELYWIEPTPMRLELIGEVEGAAIRFDSEQIVTITYHGDYHVYAYSDEGINEIASSQLPDCVRFFKVFGDTLWLSTHENGFYVYSLCNLQQPQQICHLNIPGCDIRPFAVKDTILAVVGYGDPLRLFSFGYDGHYQELANIGNYWANGLTFISHYLIVAGGAVGSSDTPIIFNIQDPANPQLVYTGSEPAYVDVSIYKHYIVIQSYLYTTSPVEYKLLDLSNPANPQEYGPLSSDAYLDNIVNDSIAVGHTTMSSLLNGNIFSGFSTIATVTHGDFAGGFPPYYIIGNKLWKLKQ